MTRAGGPNGPITSINDDNLNYGQIEVSGIDYQLNYKVATSFGELTPSLVATETYRYTAALTPGAPATERLSQANDDGNFALRWKGTLSLGWARGPYSATVAGRYIGKYQDYDSTNEVGGYWYCDASLRWTPGETFRAESPLLKHSYIQIGGINVLNRLPRYSNFDFGINGVDPAEADLRGRFLYVRFVVKE